MILHCTTLCYITLHYITLYYTILHYITLQYTILHYVALYYIILWGEVWLGFPDLWSGQKLWLNWYWPVVNCCEVRKTQLAIPLSSPPCWCPGIFSDLLRSVHILKRELGAQSNGKLPHLFIPGKTADLVHEFAVEDLTSAELRPRFLHLQWRNCLWAEHSGDDDDDDDDDESLYCASKAWIKLQTLPQYICWEGLLYGQ